MTGIFSAIPCRKQWRKRRERQIHPQRKRPYFTPQVLDEEPWTRPKPDYVFITHENVSGGKLALEEGDIFAMDVLRQYKKAVEGLRSRIGVSMPVFAVPGMQSTAFFGRLPKVKSSMLDFSSRGNFGSDFLRWLRHESIANPSAEPSGGLKFTVESDWLDDPTRILERLESQDLSVSEQRKAIAHAESLAFTGSELERLLAFYDGWIEARRFTEEDEEITAVCAAIRKYCMNMDSNRYSRYAGWLVPSTTARVHHDVDLELTKGAYWHLRYVTRESDDRLRALQAVLADEACDYMKPRLMLDKNYASITKFAIIACLLIDARQGSDEASRRVWSRKANLSMAWFDRLVKFELGKAVESIGKRDMEFASRLNELVETLDREGD